MATPFDFSRYYLGGLTGTGTYTNPSYVNRQYSPTIQDILTRRYRPEITGMPGQGVYIDQMSDNYRPKFSTTVGPEIFYQKQRSPMGANLYPNVPGMGFTPSAGLIDGEMQLLPSQTEQGQIEAAAARVKTANELGFQPGGSMMPTAQNVDVVDMMAQDNPDYRSGTASDNAPQGAAPRRTLGLLGDMFGGASALDEYMTPEQRAQMQNQGAMAAAMQLLAASGPSRTPIGLGQAIGQAYGAGQQGYQAAQQNMFQSLEMKRRMDEAKRVKELQDEEVTRARQMRELLPQAFKSTLTPEQMTINGIPARVVRDDEGNIMPGAEVTPASRQLTIDPNKLQVLAMLSKNPLESLSQIAKLVPELRKAGFTGTGAAQENPFSVFTSDPTVPDSIKKIAQQYERSYSSGQMDPEKADERVRQIGERIQSVAQFQQTQAGIEGQRAQAAAQATAAQISLDENRKLMAGLKQQGLDQSAEGKRLMAIIAQQSLDLRKQLAENQPEQLSYIQKKDFDTVQRISTAAASAKDSADLAATALPLISQAYAGVIESGVKGVAGAFGYSTEAKTANDRLTQISQQLALKTPKFGGNTSDSDAKRYDKAVGDLANPRVSPEAKVAALKDIGELSAKAQDFAQQQENYFYANNKSLKGFQYVPSNPFGR
jgi:hypothetical protein